MRNLSSKLWREPNRLFGYFLLLIGVGILVLLLAVPIPNYATIMFVFLGMSVTVQGIADLLPPYRRTAIWLLRGIGVLSAAIGLAFVGATLMSLE